MSNSGWRLPDNTAITKELLVAHLDSIKYASILKDADKVAQDLCNNYLGTLGEIRAAKKWGSIHERVQESIEQTFIPQISQQAFALPNITKFESDVIEGGIANPIKAIINRIALNYTLQMIAASTPELAATLYRNICELPGSQTRAAISIMHKLTINGPWHENHKQVLVATEESGVPRLVKVLRSEDDSELNIIQKLNLKELQKSLPLVPSKIIQAPDIPGRGSRSFNCVSMPHFSTSLQLMPQLSEIAIIAGAQRMVIAVHFLHNLNIVHMDITQNNIFVDMDGLWFLGDFGAGVQPGQPVRQTTRAYIFEGWNLEKATFDYDWFMLWATLVSLVPPPTPGPTSRNLITGDGYADMREFGLLYKTVKSIDLKRLLLTIRDNIQDEVIKQLLPS